MPKYVYIILIIILLAASGLGVNHYLSQKGRDGVTIKNGSKVSLRYKLTVDGKVVDSSEGRGPLLFEQGKGQVIQGLEDELIGLSIGDKKSITIPPEKAYGQHNQEGIKKVERAAFQNADELEVGGVVSGQAGASRFQATIIELTDKEVTIDLNHPLAGKTLNFDVEVVDVQ